MVHLLKHPIINHPSISSELSGRINRRLGFEEQEQIDPISKQEQQIENIKKQFNI